MKGLAGFMFFLLFLAGLALVNLRGVQDQSVTAVSSGEELTDTAWQPTHLGEMRLPDDTKMFVQFNADGSITGFGGCNQFSGDYEVATNALSIGQISSTRMACEEPINSYELTFLESLQIANTASRLDARLVLRDSSGSILTRFTATPRAAIVN